MDDEFDLPDGLLAMADNAAAALADMGEEYAKDASGDADKLLQFAEAARTASAEDDMLRAMHSIFAIAHDFKGQGATFGYDLLTKVGEELCEITRAKNNPCRENVPQAAKLCAAVHVILAQRLKGDGGEAGSLLCQELGIAA